MTPITPTDLVLRTLGLAKRAGKLCVGVPQICELLRKRKQKVALVVLADGASDNAKKRIHDKCAYYDVKLLPVACAPDALGHAVGSSGSIAAVAVCDEGLGALVLAQPETIEA